MSVHVTSWALRNSQSKLGDRLVMLTLAEAAHDDGTKAFPKVATIAARANLSERQVQRCLRNLVALGEIEATGKTRSGTVIYSITGYIASLRGDNMSPPSEPGVTPTSPPGVTPTSPDPSVEPSVELLAAAPQKKPPSERKRNELWDTLTDIFGPVTTRTGETLRGKHVAELAAAGATPDEIIRRARSWPNHFDSATLTAPALVKHWDTLGRKPLRRTR